MILEQIVFLLFAALLGLVLGSFYNVCIHRYQSEESVVRPRSKCPKCGTQIAWKDNIPVVSYILLRGRCRHCSEPVSLRYPVVELVSGAWSFIAAVEFGPTWSYVFYMVLGALLIIAAFIDLESFFLPDDFIVPGIILAIFGVIFLVPINPVDALLGAGSGAGFLWLLQVLYRLIRRMEGVGTGDIKLMLIFGLLLGPFLLPIMVIIAALSGLIAAVYFLRRSPEKGLKTWVPFGPFICLGGMVCLLYGKELRLLLMGF